MIYYLLALITGVIVVFNIVINSRLSQKTDIYLGTLSNYFIGALSSIVFVLLFREKIMLLADVREPVPFIYYLGGVFGAAVVIIFNAIVHRIPVMYSTILAFIGQLVMGIFLDLLIGNSFSAGRILGLTLISIGFLYNMEIDRKTSSKKVSGI
jgi:bacterial/archaeal transporter family-2 protein